MDRIILASGSQVRAELLRAAGFMVDVVPPTVADDIDIEETPDGYVRRLALAKVQAVLPHADGRSVLGAKTIVTVDGRVLERPATEDAARAMLRLLSGSEHLVTTAVCLAFVVEEARQTRTRVERTAVELAALTDGEIDWYVATGEPTQRAGAYAVQGLASRFVTRINGSYSNVVGLPVAAVYQLCVAAGLRIG